MLHQRVSIGTEQCILGNFLLSIGHGRGQYCENSHQSNELLHFYEHLNYNITLIIKQLLHNARIIQSSKDTKKKRHYNFWK